ncbi:MAG: alpha/beta hydrolase [Spirochaetaceae bacterium]
MKFKNVICLLIVGVLLSSCSTVKYKGMLVYKTDGNYYVFPNSRSDKLLIYIEGSGYKSVLGTKDDDGSWETVSSASIVINQFRKNFNVLVPEKLFYEAGQEYNSDPKALKNSTVQGFVDSYTKSINSYLSNNKFSEVILMGSSDGGALVPLIYNNLKVKDQIDKIIILAGGGGMTQLDEFKTLATSSVKMPKEYRSMLVKTEKVYKDIKENPDSITEFFLGHPYTRWSSFFDYNPIEYIKEINIPVLFIHGERDWSCPVESTKIIEDQYNKENFTFEYYRKMEHGPRNIFEFNILKRDIIKWIGIK